MSKTSFSCGEYLDINHAAKLYERLGKSLEKSTTIEIKADKVIKADTAGLQLLVTLAKEVAVADGKLIWKSPSSALLMAAKQLGVSDHLGLSKQVI